MAHGVGLGNSYPTCPTTIRQHPLPNEIFFHHLFLNALRRVNTTRIYRCTQGSVIATGYKRLPVASGTANSRDCPRFECTTPRCIDVSNTSYPYARGSGDGNRLDSDWTD